MRWDCARAVAAGSRQVCESAVREFTKASKPDFARRVNTTDFSPYDYDSDHALRRLADCSDSCGQHRTIPPGIPIGQRKMLSLGDIDAVEHMYGVPPKIDHRGHTCEWVEDRRRRRDLYLAARFDWKPGTTHLLEVPAEQGSGRQDLRVRSLERRWGF